VGAFAASQEAGGDAVEDGLGGSLRRRRQLAHRLRLRAALAAFRLDLDRAAGTDLYLVPGHGSASRWQEGQRVSATPPTQVGIPRQPQAVQNATRVPSAGSAKPTVPP
jgi:hypothetical protein